MSKPRWFDSLIGVVGLVTSLITYTIEAAGATSVDYFLVFGSTILAVLFILAHYVIESLTKYWKSLVEAKRYLDEITGTKCSTCTTIRILNENGDIGYERLIKYRIVKNKINIKYTSYYSLFSLSPLASCEVPAESISSNVTNIALIPRAEPEKTEVVGGKVHQRCKWRYEIVPPLRQRGDHLSFRYQANIAGSEKAAFTQAGCELFVLVSATYAEVQVTLIGPSGYKIEVLEVFLEDIDGRGEAVGPDSYPTVADSFEVLDWRPRYRQAGKYVCKYRLIKK